MRPAELMYGPQFAKKFVTDYLKNDIPNRLIMYRNGWNLDDITLPNPESYLTYEPLALDAWPTIITVVLSTKTFDRRGFANGLDPLYKVVYGMRTYVWVRTEGSEQTTEMRDRLTTVVRSALLDYPCLQRDGAEREAMIDESTVGEEFSDLTLLKGDRVLAGAYIAYDLSIDEVIARQDIADAVVRFDLDIGQNPVATANLGITNFDDTSISIPTD
jgi:hypothetical protein